MSYFHMHFQGSKINQKVKNNMSKKLTERPNLFYHITHAITTVQISLDSFEISNYRYIE